jgi:hypothetical protein
MKKDIFGPQPDVETVRSLEYSIDDDAVLQVSPKSPENMQACIRGDYLPPAIIFIRRGSFLTEQK